MPGPVVLTAVLPAEQPLEISLRFKIKVRAIKDELPGGKRWEEHVRA